jgi:hypothetical protein
LPKYNINNTRFVGLEVCAIEIQASWSPPELLYCVIYMRKPLVCCVWVVNIVFLFSTLYMKIIFGGGGGCIKIWQVHTLISQERLTIMRVETRAMKNSSEGMLLESGITGSWIFQLNGCKIFSIRNCCSALVACYTELYYAEIFLMWNQRLISAIITM